MREVDFNEIVSGVKNLINYTSANLPKDSIDALERAMNEEKSPVSREVLRQILENSQIASKEFRPLCQDTGLAVFFIKIGDEVKIKGGNIKNAINIATAEAYKESYLRASTCHPFTRANLQNSVGYNLPAIIHFDIVEGNKIDIEYAAKGGGSENVSKAIVLPPASGKNGIIKFVRETISKAGSNPCPPLTVGIGIGGTFEKCSISSKHALFRDIGSINPDPEMAELENIILEDLNKLGIGSMGMGGTKTVLAVHIESNPCHIASLPVSINVQCHSSRHGHITF
jgi:fumarate hydratase subunit alpha